MVRYEFSQNTDAINPLSFSVFFSVHESVEVVEKLVIFFLVELLVGELGHFSLVNVEIVHWVT
jgi:hypothetical protein